ncbi:hypothetical protein PROFUN_08626 [Planoprotostelium fungivorum]|uniref:Thioesterase-like superfamily-domain-containing protein n=1 Tax=Planoprotostelium fungivorum TaxID=1890364 RepID=A0A2P6NJ22_9EUKA|nr:hypothetical protein PROFUN_08626 [Planoprotostelium fungivorum]
MVRRLVVLPGQTEQLSSASQSEPDLPNIIIMHLFDEATRVTPVSINENKGVYRANIHPAFRIGGYLSAVVAHAGSQFLQSKSSTLTDPIHVTCQYYGVCKLGEATIEIEAAKMGRNQVNLRGRLVQNGKDVVEGHFIYGNLAKENGYGMSFKSDRDLTPFDPKKSPDPVDPIPTFAPHMDWWHDYEKIEEAGAKGQALSAAWSRFHDDRPLDPYSIIFLADCPLPAIFHLPDEVLPVKGWVPTVTISVHIIRAPSDGVTIASSSQATKFFHKGRLESDGEVKEWIDGREQIVAISRQMALFGAQTLAANLGREDLNSIPGKKSKL